VSKEGDQKDTVWSNSSATSDFKIPTSKARGSPCPRETYTSTRLAQNAPLFSCSINRTLKVSCFHNSVYSLQNAPSPLYICFTKNRPRKARFQSSGALQAGCAPPAKLAYHRSAPRRAALDGACQKEGQSLE
ncbi:hypothetical protein GOODEAATRI_010329, partial [Goodea atripinnis]